MNTATAIGFHSFLFILVLILLFIAARDILVGLARTMLGRITCVIAIVYLLQYDLLAGCAFAGFFMALIEYSYSTEGFVQTPSDEETGKEKPDDADDDDETREGLTAIPASSPKPKLGGAATAAATAAKPPAAAATATATATATTLTALNVNDVLPGLYCKNDTLIDGMTLPKNITMTGCTTPCAAKCIYAVSDANEQITAQENVTPKDSNK